MTKRVDLTIQQGKTFRHVFRWEEAPLIYKSITSITKSAPAMITVPGHGIPNGWRAAVVSVVGMKEINAENWPLRDSDLKKVTVVDANTITFNNVNASGYRAYVSGGYLVYNSPVSLVGYTARATIKDKIGGTVLETLTTVNGKIVLDLAASTIALVLNATATETYTWKKGVYDLELVSAAGEVTALTSGSVTVEKEVTN